MASPSIRGHQGSIKVYENAADSKIINVTSFEANQDSTFMRTNYVGVAAPEGDQVIEGWSGNLDAEVKDDSIDVLIDGIVTNNLNGIGVSDYTLVLTENYPDGTTASYVYFDVQMKMGRKQEGLQSKVTKKLEFQASGRSRL